MAGHPPHGAVPGCRSTPDAVACEGRGRCVWKSPGLNTWGRDVTEDESREVSIEMLHRMITYVRLEALRLRVMDVALLLEHAEDAVTAFAPASLSAPGHGSSILDATRIEH